MSLDDIEYYRRRALEERARAAEADSPEAAHAHLEMAGHYEGLVAGADLMPTARDPAANQDNEGYTI